MLAELRTKSQITVPKQILDNTGIAVGDILEITERDGGIFMYPVVVIPKKKPAPVRTPQEKRRETLRTLRGSIGDPTFVEPDEPALGTPRECIL